MIFLQQLTLAHFLEMFAAMAGSYYLCETKDISFVRNFVWFLWLTVFVEFTATYAGIAYYSNYEIFPFLKNSRFAGNYWMYNIYSIIAFSVYLCFFTFLLRSYRWRKLLLISMGVFILSSVVNLLISDVYFVAHSVFTFFAGTILVLLSIGVYYFELLKSDEILEIKYSLPFYISIGALVYHLGFVPLVIYSRYFNMDSPEFVEIYMSILYGINYFLYSLYGVAFILCSRKKKSF